MNDINTIGLSINQWFQMFILAMGIFVFCSIVTMISLWFVNYQLSEIRKNLPTKSDDSQSK